MPIEVNDESILTKLQLQIQRIPADEKLMTELHNTFALYMDPYVPMQEGLLSTKIKVDGEGVEYQSPYAHYQYTGIVYGPNIPIMKNGIIVGWYSPPHKDPVITPEFPNGKPITYNKELHQLATHHWDKAMMKDYSKLFIQDVETIITDYINKENSNGQK